MANQALPMRRIPLEKAINARDLGGYPTSVSSYTEYGRFLRTDAIHGLTQQDLETLYNRGVRTVLDLRSAMEQEIQPNDFKGYRDVKVHECPLPTIPSEDFRDGMGDSYGKMIHSGGDSFKRLFTLIHTGLGDGAVLFHCTAGKDRTGITAALLLNLAGVPDEDIVADYALTEVYLEPKIRMFTEMNPNSNPGIFHAIPQSMQRFLQILHNDFGTARDYLLHIGLTEEQIDGLWG